MATDDHKPPTVHYVHRSEPTRRSSPPAAQLADIARVHAEQLAGDPAARLRAQVLEAFEEYEQERAATERQWEAAEEGGLMALAEAYARAHSPEERAERAEQIGSTLSLPEAGTLRAAAKAVEAALPGIVVDAHVDGWSAPEIARELGLNSRSYVYRILRENPWEALWILYRGAGADGWERVADGIEETSDTADDLAQRIVDTRLDEESAAGRVRVCVWRTGDGDDPEEARGVAEFDFTPDDEQTE